MMKRESVVFAMCLCFALMLAVPALAEQSAGAESEVRQSGSYKYIVLEDGTAKITAFTDYNAVELILPNELDSYKVTQIGTAILPQSDNFTKSIVVPEGVVRLDDYAFRRAPDLEKVSLPDSLIEVGENPFRFCGKLKEIVISEDHPALRLTDYGLVSLKDRRLICLPSQAEFEIFAPEEGLEIIGNYALEGKYSITRAVIPASVKKIGKNPFNNCHDLTAIEVAQGNEYYEAPDGVLYSIEDRTLISFPEASPFANYFTGFYAVKEGTRRIGAHAFYNCSNLPRIELPDGLERIDESAFEFCHLSEIRYPESLTSVGDYAFWGAGIGGGVPSTLTEIGDYAYDGCMMYGLEDSVLRLPEGLVSAGKHAFASISAEKVIIPAEIMEISEGMFSQCSSLRSIELPESLRRIGKDAFSDCSQLNEIVLPEGVESIGEEAFEDCSSLTSIGLPRSLEEIGARAFKGCKSLEDIELPEGLKRMDVAVFSGCPLRSVTLPSTLMALSSNPFSGCATLETILVTEENTRFEVTDGALYDVGTGTLAALPTAAGVETLAIREGTVTIGEYALVNQASLKTVTLPGSIKWIEFGAFFGCSGLESVALPEGMERIGDAAFYQCAALKGVSVPASVTSIGDYAFRDTPKDLRLTVARDSYAQQYAQDHSIQYTFVRGGIGLSPSVIVIMVGAAVLAVVLALVLRRRRRAA